MFDPDVVSKRLKTRLEKIDPNWKNGTRCSYLNQYEDKYHLAELSFQYESEYVHRLSDELYHLHKNLT